MRLYEVMFDPSGIDEKKDGPSLAGEVRAYVWAENREQATRLYHERNKKSPHYKNGRDKIGFLNLLLDTETSGPFSTCLSDLGWSGKGQLGEDTDG